MLEQQSQTNEVEAAEKVRFLSNPASYPDAPARLEVVETHFAWVFLTPHFAYKLKKPGWRPPMDLSSVDARHRACQQELQLNQRWAPGTYLEVVPLVRDQRGRLKISGNGQAVDWLIAMKRLPTDRMLDIAIRKGNVRRRDIDRLGATLSDFYMAASAVKISTDEYIAGFRQSLRQINEEVAVANDDVLIESSRQATSNLSRFLAERAARLAVRVQEGRVIECHGDLRPEHICLCEPIRIIDRLEFSRALRVLDVLEELAFFSLECEQLNAGWVFEGVFRIYLERSGDRAQHQLMRFYRSHRSLIRCMLMVRRVRESEPAEMARWRKKAANYLGRARADSAEAIAI